MAGSVRLEVIDRLHTAIDDLAWIVGRVPKNLEAFRWEPHEWSVRTTLAHLVTYESRYAMPSLVRMAESQDATGLELTGSENDLEHPDEALERLSAAELVGRLISLGEERADILRRMSDDEFSAAHRSIWGPQNALWVVEKSFGHIREHGVPIFYFAHMFEFRRSGLADMSLAQRERVWP